jgi:hypothetical protein
MVGSTSVPFHRKVKSEGVRFQQGSEYGKGTGSNSSGVGLEMKLKIFFKDYK